MAAKKTAASGKPGKSTAPKTAKTHSSRLTKTATGKTAGPSGKAPAKATVKRAGKPAAAKPDKAAVSPEGKPARKTPVKAAARPGTATRNKAKPGLPDIKKTGSRTRTAARKSPLKTVSVTVSGKKYRIPVDGRGYVPPWALALKFVETRRGNQRAAAADLKRADRLIGSISDRLKPGQVAGWWADPTGSDIAGIDDATSGAFDTSGATRPSSLGSHAYIPVIGTKSERKRVHETLDACFSAAEVKLLAETGTAYAFVRDGEGLSDNAAGLYRSNEAGILVKNKRGKGTIIHESVHKLRHKDKTRTGKFTTSKLDEMPRAKTKNEQEHLRAVEEAATECETVTRLNPFGARGKRTSYYGFIRDSGLSPSEMIEKDREKLTGDSKENSRGFRGRKAIKAVEENFTETYISGYKGKSTKMARDYEKSP